MRTEILRETSLYVDDLESAERFYGTVIGLKVARRVPGESATFHYDDTTLTLFQARLPATEPEGRAHREHGQVSFGISAGEISPWLRVLQRHGIAIDEEVVWPNGAQSISFHDPSGNRIELKTQVRRFQDVTGDRRLEQPDPGGLHAEWKIYHAANLGLHSS